SPVRTRTPTYYLDFKVNKGSKMTQALPVGWNAFVYVLAGRGLFGPHDDGRESEAHYTLVLSDGDKLEVENKGSETLHFVLLAGEPVGEPVVQYGPFVMTTRGEIEEAIDDFRSGKNGFENALNWKSKTGNNV
ncbi:pirin-like, partial [Saccoglossus kowalevskii]|uniref:Pirin-like n=1 Tax=Saccoglossus kowalevskii TaxID=10224 RepID=A0ABM0MBT8_SACKO